MSALSRFRIVNVAKSAGAGVATGQIQAILDVARTIMRTSNALVHIDAQAESGRPFVAAPMAFAAHVNLIRSERLEVAILIPVQHAFSMRCVTRPMVVSSLEGEKTSRVVNCARGAHGMQTSVQSSTVVKCRLVVFVVDKTRIPSVELHAFGVCDNTGSDLFTQI